MLNQIFTHTPHWVWGLLIALLWLGLNQVTTRTVSLKRVTVMPLAMVGLSLYGTVSAFGAEPLVLLVWLACAGLLATLVMQRPLDPATRYDDWTERFTVPGSWVPLALILGIFVTKYFVGASTSMHPALVQDDIFRLGFTALYGAFSGIFLARAARLWRLVWQAYRPVAQVA